MRTGGQALVQQLMREGVRDVFGIPGVQLDWAVDALREHADSIRYFVPRHEQSASYMADGYARSGGGEGVCMVVPGPGVLNALSGLATAWACNGRMLFIAGQTPSHTIGRGYGMLHEIADQGGILKSLTKWHARARSAGEVAEIVHEAFRELRSGRPRPVAIEVPPDVLEAQTDAPLLEAAAWKAAPILASAVREAASMLSEARFPVIVAGGGVAAARASTHLARLAETLQAPVVMTEGGRGVLSDRHSLALNSLGGRAVLPHADVMLVAGSRFLNALAEPAHVNPKCKFIYLNIEPSDRGSPRQPGCELDSDAGVGLSMLAEALSGSPARASRADDVARVRAWCASQYETVQPQSAFASAIRAAMPDNAILVSELTQVGYFANVAFPIYRAGGLLTPGFQGTLGYGYPTALGAAVANPESMVVSLTGDGGFGWSLQELATAVRYNLNVKVVVFEDGRFGNVQRIQRRVFGKEFATEVQNPDFELLARAFGAPSFQARSPEELGQVLAMLEGKPGPSLIHVRVGEMASPWALIHPFVAPPAPAPPNPLGDASS